MSKVKLHNKGQRKIVIGEIEFLPGQTRAFSKADSDKLISLFGGEVEDIEQALKQFDEVEGGDGDSEPKVFEGWVHENVAEIKAFLKANEVEYASGALKQELVDLAEAKQKALDDAAALGVE